MKISFAPTTSGDPLPPITALDLEDGSSISLPTPGTSSAPTSRRSSVSAVERPQLGGRTLSSTSEMPPGYQRRVGFSTLDSEEGTGGGGIGAEFSFTLQAKSEGFVSGRESRCFLVASDGASYSVSALDWLVATLVEDGDEVVVLRVIEPGSREHKEFVGDVEEGTREEARDVLQHVLEKNDRLINVTVEFVIGSTIETIQRMLEVYRPDSLVVGTRGRSESAWKKAFLGSTSQYLVARSPIPVIVVRPERKVKKSIEARRNDPKRRSYQMLLGHKSSDQMPMLSTGVGEGRRLSVDMAIKTSKELRREKTVG